jgi:gliding motility-associated protein GldM
MGLFLKECIHCGSKEHTSEDCPHGAFSSKKCIHCGSIEHASENCPHGTFSSKKCIHCGSIEHASEDCPHGTFSSKKCIHCGSKEHASEDCPHGVFSSKKCIHCGSNRHASENCPHGVFGKSTAAQTTTSSTTGDNGLISIIGWLVGVGIIIFVAIWLAVNIVLPIILLNSALGLTIIAIVKKQSKTIFAVLAIFGGAYMLVDVYNGWLSANFVNNIVKTKAVLTVFIYVNSVAMGISTWILVQPIVTKAINIINVKKNKAMILLIISVFSVIVISLTPPIVYYFANGTNNLPNGISETLINIENGLSITNNNLEVSNSGLFVKMDKAFRDNRNKAINSYDKTQNIKAITNELINNIYKVRKELLINVEGVSDGQSDTLQLSNIIHKGEISICSKLLVGNNPNSPIGLATTLKKQIEEYKKNIYNILNEPNFSRELITMDRYSDYFGKSATWEINSFYLKPIEADLCNLQLLHNTVLNIQNKAINNLLKTVHTTELDFNEPIKVMISTKSALVPSGDKFCADIFLKNTNQIETILIGNIDTSDSERPKIIGTSSFVPIKAGIGKYEVTTGAEGLQKYSGVVNVKLPTGEMKSYPFSGEYMVVGAFMAISPTSMNIFYIGSPNPVSISVAGVAPNDITASLTGASGSIKNLGQGKYEVNVSAGTTCDINVSAKVNNASKSIGKQTFRIQKK